MRATKEAMRYEAGLWTDAVAQLENGAIDIEQVKTMVDLFIAAGGTYFDTAFVYEGSEEASREALVKRYPREI